jgi:hypothetical protein
MQYRILFFLLAMGALGNVSAQRATNYHWYNPAEAGMNVIEGQGWPKEVRDRYDRLPARAEGQVRKDVWDLSRNSAGLMIRFKANTNQIRIRYAISGRQALAHMPATGVSGVDLYAIDEDGTRRWCAANFVFGDTVEYKFLNLDKAGREYRLYLPLYNTVKWLEVGVPDSMAFTFLPVRTEKPVVVYGTSITQGACSSRPGMCWTAILSRKLDQPLINLGFSGNGKLEKEVVDLVKELDARLFVLDCLPNMTDMAPGEVKSRIIAAVQSIRQKSRAPILLTEHAGYMDGGINLVRRKLYTDVNQWAEDAFAELKRSGVRDIYLLTKKEIGLEQDMMVDGTHPTDLGMQRYADGYEKCIRKIKS